MPHSTLTGAMVVALAAAIAAAGCGGTNSATPAVEPATTGPGAIATGKEIFVGVSGCGGCHTLADAGSKSSVASNLDEKKPSEARVRAFVTKGKDAMPSYEKQLGKQEIAAVAAYVTAVAGR